MLAGLNSWSNANSHLFFNRWTWNSLNQVWAFWIALFWKNFKKKLLFWGWYTVHLAFWTPIIDERKNQIELRLTRWWTLLEDSSSPLLGLRLKTFSVIAFFPFFYSLSFITKAITTRTRVLNRCFRLKFNCLSKVYLLETFTFFWLRFT